MTNIQSAIKIAYDFVSLDNIGRMAHLIPQQRLHRIQSGDGEDFLRLKTVLWYAWQSASIHKRSMYDIVQGAVLCFAGIVSCFPPTTQLTQSR